MIKEIWFNYRLIWLWGLNEEFPFGIYSGRVVSVVEGLQGCSGVPKASCSQEVSLLECGWIMVCDLEALFLLCINATGVIVENFGLIMHFVPIKLGSLVMLSVRWFWNPIPRINIMFYYILYMCIYVIQNQVSFKNDLHLLYIINIHFF